MDRRRFLKAAALTGLGAIVIPGTLPGVSRPAPVRPNVLVMMADDVGYGDLGCYGGFIRTPALDGLAREGARFTDFYAAAPNCSPSRAALLTGRFPTRCGIYSYVPAKSPMHLPASEITLARLLRDAGYATAHAGKWHLAAGLGDGRLPDPGTHGFDYWLGTESNSLPSHKNPVNFVRNGEALGEVKGYSCDIVADEAIRWLKEGRDPGKPFFLNLWFHEAHKKVAAPADLRAHYAEKKGPIYHACIENMDRAIGRLLAELDAMDLAVNTVVFFTSDNGSYRAESNGGLRERKSFVFEGGIREPALVRWPGKVTAGRTITDATGMVDLLPTVCALAGIEKPSDRTLDGVNLVPLLWGESKTPLERERPLFWFFYRTDPACALREGRWSLVGYLDEKVPPGHSFRKEHMDYIRRSRPNRFELFDLEKDRAQKANVAEKHPEVFARLVKRMKAIHAEVVKEGPEWYADDRVNEPDREFGKHE